MSHIAMSRKRFIVSCLLISVRRGSALNSHVWLFSGRSMRPQQAGWGLPRAATQRNSA
jgi:hypothetical protein